MSGRGARPALPGCGARRPGCPPGSAEAQGAFVWVTSRPRKTPPAQSSSQREEAVGQVRGDSGGPASLSVFVEKEPGQHRSQH